MSVTPVRLKRQIARVCVAKGARGTVLHCLAISASRKTSASMERLKPVALLLLRVALGVVFIYHGYPKLFTHTRQTMYALTHEDGLPAYFAYIAGVIEF